MMKTFKQLLESIKQWKSIDGNNAVVGETETHYKVKTDGKKYERLIRKSEFEREVAFEVKQYNSRMKRRGAVNSDSDISNELPAEIKSFTSNMSKLQAGKATKTLLDKGIRSNGKFYKNKYELAKALKTKGYSVDGNNLVSKSGSFIEGGDLGKTFVDFYKTIA